LFYILRCHGVERQRETAVYYHCQSFTRSWSRW